MDKELQDNKSWVHYWEEQSHQAGEELKQLDPTIKEEGLFCVEWCVVMSLSIVSLCRFSQLACNKL